MQYVRVHVQCTCIYMYNVHVHVHACTYMYTHDLPPLPIYLGLDGSLVVIDSDLIDEAAAVGGSTGSEEKLLV